MAFVPPFLVLSGLLLAALAVARIVSIGRREHRRWRILAAALPLSVFALVALAIAIIGGFDALTSPRNEPPGTLYAVDGHRMRIDCQGAGSPALVLDAGLGSDGLIWSGVQPALARTTRTCSFDRAGYGWSEPAGSPRDADHLSAELHGLLMAAGIRGPIILVGHSIAGLYIRRYAIQYPEQVEAAATGSFGSLPILVISRWTQNDDWNRKQESLTRLSLQSRRIIAAHSGHYVQIDRPSLLEEQVRLFVQQLRGNASCPTYFGTTQVL